MNNWFLEIFSSPSEKAKLITIVISTVVAICLLLANQWFIARKAKKDLYISKIEDLLSSVYFFERLTKDILEKLYDIGVHHEDVPKKIAEGTEQAYKIEMLSNLYFPEIEFDFYKSQQITGKVVKQFEAVDLNNEYPKKEYQSYRDSLKMLNEIIDPIKSTSKKLMKKLT